MNAFIQGDTLQNVAKELDKVLWHGYFSFKLPIDGDAQMTIEFSPPSILTSSLEDASSSAVSQIPSSSKLSQVEPNPDNVEEGTGKGSKSEQWSSEQIGDFVRKLGFMDTEKEGGEKIKHFRHISAVSSLLTTLHIISSHLLLFIDCLPSTGAICATKRFRQPSLL